MVLVTFNERYIGGRELADSLQATLEELKEVVGVEKGAVPPLGPLFGVEMIVDSKLFENEFMAFNAGSLETSIKMRTHDYKKVVDLRVEDVAEG